ncbi:MAG: type II secretion system secretin GspD [Gammaproteobacteria bacterium]
MKSPFTRIFTIAILYSLLVFSLPMQAGDSTAINLDQVSALSGKSPDLPEGAFVGKPETHTWNLENADIRTVIDEISRETGKNFVVDPTVEGKISIVSSTPMNSNEVYQVFLSTLQALGYAAIPSGRIIKIVPNTNAKSLGSTLANNNNPGRGDEVVTRVFALTNVPAEQLAPLLRGLVPDWGNVTAYSPSNVLIAVGPADALKRIAEIVHRVDTTNTNGIEMISLRYASAIDVAASLQSLQDSSKAQGITPDVSIASDPVNNAILLSGNRHARLKMRVLISELDSPNAGTAGGNTQVIYLKFLKAQDLVPILAGVARSYYQGPVGTIIGTRTPSGNDYAAISENPSELASTPAALVTQVQAPSNQTSQQAQTNITQGTGPGSENKPKIELIAEPNTNSIIINAPPSLRQTLRNVVAQLDIRPAQVLVEAIIAEVDQKTAAALGIQWGSITPSNALGILPIDSIAGFRAGIGIITGEGVHNLQGIIKALAHDQKANILSTPSILVLDNHQAKILIGQEVSIQQSTYPSNAGGAAIATPYSTFNREKVALHLYVTPQINQGKSISLNIDEGNDTLQNPAETTTTPIVNISSIKTSVMINSGDIIVLGGLIQNQFAVSKEKIPILGDLPVVGHLFGIHSRAREKKDLMVFLRPIIVTGKNAERLTTNKYDFVREEELEWLRKEYYTKHMQDSVAPPLHTAHLQKPFERTGVNDTDRMDENPT